jgi:hypothetical protein
MCFLVIKQLTNFDNMNEPLIISLSLLALAVLDAVGDAFRFRGWNIPHHVVESVHVGGWVLIWALFGFAPVYVWLYVLGRIVLFDIVFNLVGGLPIGYIGKTSIYDLLVTALGGWVKQNPANFAFIFRFMALTTWIALLIKTV